MFLSAYGKRGQTQGVRALEDAQILWEINAIALRLPTLRVLVLGSLGTGDIDDD